MSARNSGSAYFCRKSGSSMMWLSASYIARFAGAYAIRFLPLAECLEQSDESRLKHQRHPPLKEGHSPEWRRGRWDRIQGLGRFSFGCCFAASKDSRACSAHLLEPFLESLGHPSTLQRTSLEPALASLRQPFCLAYLLIWLSPQARARRRGDVAFYFFLRRGSSAAMQSAPHRSPSRDVVPSASTSLRQPLEMARWQSVLYSNSFVSCTRTHSRSGVLGSI